MKNKKQKIAYFSPVRVRNYTDKQLIDRMRSLPSFMYVPAGEHFIVVRSNEDTPDTYDDKFYLFRGDVCLAVTSCTSNSGTYGLLNFPLWDSRGAAIIKFDEIYYNSFMKSDGDKVRHHNGKVQCFRQIRPIKYYRDNNKDNKVSECGEIYFENNATNIHPNSYKYRTGIRSWIIGGWSTGCTVVNNLSMYWDVLMKKTPDTPITYTGLKEF